MVAALLLLCQPVAAGTASARPVPAISFVLSTFRRVPIVAVGGGLHGRQDLDDFVRKLIRDPRFARSVHNVVIETGNSLYQPLLDRFVMGENVPIVQLQQVWRNTTQPFANRTEQKNFIEFVRDLNLQRAPDQQIRVLAADPPIDWARVHRTSQFVSYIRGRDANAALVIEHDVLAKHERALLLFGDFHVLRHVGVGAHLSSTVTTLLEHAYPHSTYVIIAHSGFGPRNAELEPRLQTWPVPSIAKIRDTWLGALDPFLLYNDTVLISDPSKKVDPFPGGTLQDLADAYLYLGLAATVRNVTLPEDTDPIYARELSRRQQLMGGPMQPIPIPLPAPSADSGVRRSFEGSNRVPLQ